VEQHTDGQYDDDLTVGVDDYAGDSIETDFVDLFEFSGGDESPISRLKTIMLELDWEITDEILTQFNEELIDLKDVWSDEPIKIVYVQALEKISKYIYQQKSDAHPSSIKLLLAFYYNLEKIDFDSELSEEDKNEILQADLQKFEKFKKYIGAGDGPPAEEAELQEEVSTPMAVTEEGAPDPSLFNLKACILGMDWEITDRELNDLSQEVKHLQGEFNTNRARMLFLQGIDSLGGYIKLKKSDAHADAFKLLYSFYEGLEKIVVNDLGREEEKAILLPEVEKFDQFKQLIAPTITPEAIAEQNRAEQEAEFSPGADTGVAPAFAEIEDEEVQGFQAEEEVADLGNDAPDDVLDQLDTFFTDDDETAPSELEPAVATDPVAEAVSAEDALRGVDVETEADDDSDEEALPTEGDGVLAPALSDANEETGFSADSTAAEVAAESDGVSQAEIEDRLSGFFGDEPEEVEAVAPPATEDPLAGVDVETEADDDADEGPLLTEEGGLLAPALADSDEVSGFSAEATEEGDFETAEISPDDIEDRMSGFFDDRRAADPESSAEIALEGVNVETDADDDSEEVPLPLEDDGVLAPALAEAGEESEPEAATDDAEASISPDEIEERMAGFFGDEPEEEVPVSADDAAAEELAIEAESEALDIEAAGDESPVERTSRFEDSATIAPALTEADAAVEPELVLEPEADNLAADEFTDTATSDEPEAGGLVTPEAVITTEGDGDVEEPTDGLTSADIEGRLSQFFGDEPETEESGAIEVDRAEERISADLEESVEPALSDAAEITLDEEAAEYEPVLTEAVLEDEIAGEPAESEELPFESSEEPQADGAEPALDEDVFAERAGELPDELVEEFELEPEDSSGVEVFLDEGGAQDEAVSDAEEPAAEEEISASVDTFFVEESEHVEDGGLSFADDDAGSPASEPEGAEEVVFAPIDETTADFQDAGEIPVAIVEKDAESYTTFDSDLDEQDFFAEIDEKVEEPGEFKQELLDETEDFETQTLTLPDEDAIEAPLAEEGDWDVVGEQPAIDVVDEPEPETFFLTSEDDLADLRTSIASLGVEINDTIIDGVLNDVNSLRQRFMDKPVDMILLELISTIVQHIGQYGYESSAEAHGLLLSAFDKLEHIQVPDTDPKRAQELLLSETSKVLFWQQSMLDRQAIKKGDQLTFMDPLRSVAKSEPGDDGASAAGAGGEIEIESDLAFNAEMDAADGADEPAETGQEPELDLAAAEFIKQEMASLKESLRAEIEALRDQLKDKD
jgi:pilus assembly protein FimV